MSANLNLVFFGVFAIGVLVGLLLMWLPMRGRVKSWESRQAQLEEENKDLQEVKVQLSAKISALETSLEAEAEKQSWLSRAQDMMREAFQALAAQALTSNSEQFLIRTRESVQNFVNQMSGGWQAHKAELQNLVQPLDQALKAMSQHVRDLEGKREGAYSDLKANLSQISQLNQELQKETSKLSHALRGGVQQRGRWAEFQLQRLAEMAGMKDRVDFNLQMEVGAVRPDMVVQLPREGCIVVDAKAPMTYYLQALELDNEEARRKKLEEHARGVKHHIDLLRSKEYAHHLPQGSQFVVMYLPSDACLIAALDSDNRLLEYAFDKQIILAAPTTLFALLKTVATGWQQYLMDENAREILAHGQELLRRLHTFTSHFAGIGKGLRTAVDRFNDAVGSFESRVLPEARRFQELRGSSETLPEIETVDSQPRALEPPEAPEPQEEAPSD